jgi:hypothetical protein
MLLELGVTEKVKQLRREGLRPSEQLVRSITKAGAAAVEPLLALATEVELLHKDQPECFAPLHALRLLGELESVEIVEPLLRQLPVSLEYEDEKLPEMWANEVSQIIGHLGKPALDLLWQIADDTGWNYAGRSGALTALGYATAADPTLREPVVAGLRERLASGTDLATTSYLAMALANLGVRECYPEVMAMYRESKIDQDILPAAAARQLLLSDSAKRLACANHPLWERYDQHGPFLTEN